MSSRPTPPRSPRSSRKRDAEVPIRTSALDRHRNEGRRSDNSPLTFSDCLPQKIPTTSLSSQSRAQAPSAAGTTNVGEAERITEHTDTRTSVRALDTGHSISPRLLPDRPVMPVSPSSKLSRSSIRVQEKSASPTKANQQVPSRPATSQRLTSSNPMPPSTMERSNESHPTSRVSPAPSTSRHTLKQPASWMGFPELKVDLNRVPAKYGTSDVHKLFSVYGELHRIELFEPRFDGTKKGWVIFRPPPTNSRFIYEGLAFTDIGGKHHRIECFVNRSDGQEGSTLGLTTVRLGQLDVGIMRSEEEMLVFHTSKRTHPGSQLSLTVNKSRKFFDIVFGLNSSSSETPRATTTNLFKISVNISQIKSIYIVEHEDGKVSLVLPLEMPPYLFRKTNDVASTHDSQSGSWNESQTWYRQTGIDVNAESRKEITQLRKRKPLLDVGRWLTYRLTVTKEVANSPAFRTLQESLIELNVKFVRDRPITTVSSRAEEMWRWQERPEAVSNRDAGSFWLNEMIAPSTKLTFMANYHLEVCLSQNVLHECNITQAFLQKLASIEPQPTDTGLTTASRVVKLLEKASSLKTRFYNPMDILGLEHKISMKEKKMPRHCTMIPSATVTPTTIYMSNPVLETSNRIIRMYSHLQNRFLRVKFTDEKYRGKILAADANDNSRNEIFTRVKRTMTNGIRIAGRHYEFLAYGNSQFREHGAYFFAPTETLTAEMIRNNMGDFGDIKVVAKLASRIGQCFSTTRAMRIKVIRHDIPDITRTAIINGRRKESNFTDGVGKIAPFLAQMIAEEWDLPNCMVDYPSVIQFRLGGGKGVLTVDPSLKGRTIHVRPSQIKFPAKFHGIEVCRMSQFGASYLNMQVILILSALGVSNNAFLRKLREALENLEMAMTSAKKAVEELNKNVDFNQISLVLASMVENGFMRTQEPFMMSCLRLWRSWITKYLKEKARILIEKGAFVLGCVDETGTLKGHFEAAQKQLRESGGPHDVNSLPEIFLQIPERGQKGKYRIIEGLCILTRNPALHAGDVRVVRAVDVAQLHHLKNCVVLPQTGDRDLAFMCSGGDLDGDDYLVMWDETIMPQEWNHEPMDYESPPVKESDKPITVDAITSFFVTHMKNDNLGRIATAHRYWADWHPEGVKHPMCIELAQLHSMAVDYAKTGQPAEMPKRLHVKQWPHWAEPKNKRVYHSKRILGQLYDEVQRVPFLPAWENSFDSRILDAYPDLDESTLAAARQVKTEYDEAVRRIMAQHDVKSEFEVWTTFVLEHSSEVNDYKFAESFGETVLGLKSQYQIICYAAAGTTPQDKEGWQKMGPFIAAMYRVTAREFSAAKGLREEADITGDVDQLAGDESSQRKPFISFPWIFEKELGQIALGNKSLSIMTVPTKSKKNRQDTGQPAAPVAPDFELPPLPEVVLEHGRYEIRDSSEIANPRGLTTSLSKKKEDQKPDIHTLKKDITLPPPGSKASATPSPSANKPSIFKDDTRKKTDSSTNPNADAMEDEDSDSNDAEIVTIDSTRKYSAFDALEDMLGR